MWQMNDEVMNYKMVATKCFGKVQTCMWKTEGGKSYFVTVHTPEGKLLNVKFHPTYRGKETNDVKPSDFTAITTAMEFNAKKKELDIALDITTEYSERFVEIWKEMLRTWVNPCFDWEAWNITEMRFLIYILLDAKYAEGRVSG